MVVKLTEKQENRKLISAIIIKVWRKQEDKGATECQMRTYSGKGNQRRPHEVGALRVRPED